MSAHQIGVHIDLRFLPGPLKFEQGMTTMVRVVHLQGSAVPCRPLVIIDRGIGAIFRIVAIGILGWYIAQQVKKQARWGYIVCLAMIMAGAAGNIFDSMFYGLIFNASSEFYTSYFVPFGTGYAPFLMGKVVDMFYFPLIVTTWPDWIPYVGGNPYVFFSPIFNFADSSISVGVVLLLLFYRKEISEITLKSKHEA